MRDIINGCKYYIKKKLLYLSGYMSYRWNNLSPGIYCFNYHRIGCVDSTDFDPGVFSCDPFHFEKQVKFFKDNFEVIDTHRLVEIIQNKEVVKKPTAIITFDDGYVDNYQYAFPVLKKLQIPAVFFLPTSYIDSNKISWWDEIAWLINQCNKKKINFNGQKFILDSKTNKKTAIKKILNCVKNRESIPMEDSIQELSEITDCKFHDKPDIDKLFMNWDQVNEMIASGMCVGSHTHNHIIMSHHSKSEQLEEVSISKQILESKTGVTIDTFSYPVGERATYTEQSKQVLKQAGYIAGFNFIEGFNKNIYENQYDIYRYAVFNNGLPIDIKYSIITTPDIN